MTELQFPALPGLNPAADQLNRIEGMLRQLLQWQIVTAWISVTDALPKSRGSVLVWGPDETNSKPYHGVASYDGEWGWTGRQEVTHWQALPLGPEDI
jgi:hypothetical protein